MYASIFHVVGRGSPKANLIWKQEHGSCSVTCYDDSKAEVPVNKEVVRTLISVPRQYKSRPVDRHEEKEVVPVMQVISVLKKKKRHLFILASGSSARSKIN